jgi:hypothetical protein
MAPSEIEQVLGRNMLRVARATWLS